MRWKSSGSKVLKEDPRLRRVSAICSALPETVCAIHEDYADFRVRKKVFAYFLNNHHGDRIVSICVKSELGENVDRSFARPDLYYLPAYIGKRGWFGMRLDRGAIDWKEVENIIHLSYRLVAPKTLVARSEIN
jgi:predicted DNA-binding protein (MmcQ/YjbR family)